MSFTQCKLSTASDGSGWTYIFAYNPKDYDARDDYGVTSIDILHGAPAFQKISFDGRPRVMKWENMSTSAAVETMISTFKARAGKIYYIQFNTMGNLNHFWPGYSSNASWYKMRLVDLKLRTKPGGAGRYDSIELWLCPQQ